jgi:hypothetical protein
MMHLDREGWRCDGTLLIGKPIYIFDDKTTYQMGFTWADQWKLRSQFRCYTWAAMRRGYPISGAIVRGAGIQKLDIKHTEALNHYAHWQIDEWYATTIATIKDMLTAWDALMNDYHGDPETLANAFRKDLDGACTMYGGCMFSQLCTVQRHSDWINSGFIERTWSPIDEEAI